jgi:dimethylsulfone monooxygenase
MGAIAMKQFSTKKRIFGGNRLKLGTFCTNTVNATTLAPEQQPPEWSRCLQAARLADKAGFEAITPIARWKGYVDHNPDHMSHEIMEAFTFAAAVAQATEYATVFATSHAPTVHPVAVAKQAATIDHISGGRFALNIVGGWNRREFDMFGIDLLDHDQRYDYLADWLQVLRRLWTGEEFDYESIYFHMKGALCRPRPAGGPIPIMNAATSLTGMRFAARYSDIGFCMPRGSRPDLWKAEIEQYKALARDEFGREISIWTNASVVQRDTVAEAEDYLRYYTQTMLDEPSINEMIATMIRENNWNADDPKVAFMRQRMAGGSGYPVVGDAERIADELALMVDAGIDGVLMTWVDPLDGLQRFNSSVLPLLEAKGLRDRFDTGNVR